MHEDYFLENAEKWRKGELTEIELRQLRAELDAVEARGALTPALRSLRDELASGGTRSSKRHRSPPSRRGCVMEVLLLGIYAAIVWFIFIKMKWLPWTTATQVIVVIIPVVALTALVLALNVVAPSSADVRVIKYVINIVPQVRGA